ncbi:cyclase family protein [Streptomyces sp. NPDC059477]|uniref:cyclase family protein n=1 Tax=Streptomyces sp. NPDC059477 TaxID=3346847 RepID=UPI00367DBFB7
MAPIFDLTHPLEDRTEAYPGDPGLTMETVHQHSERGYWVTLVKTGSHVGTHVDAPFHVLAEGRTVDELDLDHLVGPATVVAVPHAVADGSIRLADVERAITPGARILVRTGWASRFGTSAYHGGFPQLDEPLAEALAEAGVKMIGLEQPSVHRDHATGLRIHQRLLGAECYIVEGLDLSRVPPGPVHVTCLPLKLAGVDGAPVRAIATTEGH